MLNIPRVVWSFSLVTKYLLINYNNVMWQLDFNKLRVLGAGDTRGPNEHRPHPCGAYSLVGKADIKEKKTQRYYYE